ncbi:MAG: RHS repeat domain-containing protein, partial [Flavobacteriales bacterium]
MHKHIVRIFVFVIGSVFFRAYAQPNIPSILIDYPLNTFPGSTDFVGSVTDPAYSAIAANTADFRDKEAAMLVSLYTDPDENACYPGYMKIQVQLEVNYRTVNPFGSPSSVITDIITLETEKSPDLVTRDKERAFKVYPNAYWSDVSILSVSATREDGSTVSYADIPADVKVNLELQRTRYYNLGTLSTSIAVPPAGSVNTYFTRDNVFYITWTPLSWASAYEVEWTYVNDYAASGGLGSSLPASSLPVQFRNRSSRVRVPATQRSYFIPVIYSRGYICARVRPLTKGGPELEDDLFGTWSFDSLNTGSYTVADVPADALFAIDLYNSSTLVNNLNAQYGITFSEEGKILPQGTYADGSLRIRQNNVAVKADVGAQTSRNDYGRLGVVTETIYDFLGRPAVTTLPGVTEPGFWYKANYNLDDNGNKYSYLNFDFDTPVPGTCYAESQGMDTTRGVSRYYSAQNPNKNRQQARLPDALKFPFTRVIYEADNASRPKIQSGVGYEHRIGSGHETQYVYGNPSQEDLNRLFGTDAGYAPYYQKSMIIDANGQVSITYTDLAGKTIATSLAGVAPEQLDPLLDSLGQEWQDLGEERTEDLLELSASNLHGNQNLVSADSLGYTLNRYLLVASEKEYAFDYEFFPEEFSPACVPGFCADCVYDLEISLRDDCGNYLLGNDSLSGPMILRIPGSALNNVCDGPDSYAFDTVLTLQPGVYNLLKQVRVNTEAIESYLDTLMAMDTCLLTLDDFYTAPSLSDCFITCDSCLAAVGTLTAFLEENLEAFNGDSVAVTMAYNNLKDQCEGLCGDQYKDECTLGWEMMLYDVSPLGQYAQHDNGDASAYPLSLFNEANAFPRRDVTQFDNPFGAGNQPGYTVFNQPPASWRNPRYRHPLSGEWLRGYYDVYGNRVRISMYDDGNGNELPALAAGESAYTDPLTGARYAYPEQLATLSGFLSAWQPSFARSLVVYHPEYFKYEFCSDALTHTVSIDNGSGTPADVNTYEYANILQRYTAALAMSELGITSGMTRAQIIDRLLENDPFFASTVTTYASGNLLNTTPALSARDLLLGELTYYQNDNGLVLDAVGTAFANVNCGPASPSSCILSVPSVINLANPAIQPDQVWRQIAVLYATARHKAMGIAMDVFPKTKRAGIFTDCIGEDLYIYPFNYTSVSFGGVPANPCHLPEFILYTDKTQRFPTMASMLSAAGFNDPPAPEELEEYGAQAGFTATGKCPMQIDFENMLGQLALNGKLLSSNTTDLNAGPYLGTALHNWLDNEGNGYNASISVSSGSIDIIIAGNCTTTLSWPGGAPAGLDWDDVYFITDVHDGKLYGYTGPGPDSYIEIPFSTCLTLTGCSSSTAAVCKPTAEIREIQALMNALSSAGTLWNTTPFTLGSYGPLLGYGLKSILGDNAPADYSWVFSSTPAPHFLLSNSVSGAVLTIDLDTGSSSLSIPPAQPYTFTNFYQLPAVTGSPSQQAGFSFGAVESDGITPYYIDPASTEESLRGTLSVSGGLRNAYGSTCDVIPDPRCRTEQHIALRILKDRLEVALYAPQALDEYEDCFTFPPTFTDGTPFDYDDVSWINEVRADMTRDEDGQGSHYAVVKVTLANTDTASFVMQSCMAMRNCDPCAQDTCLNAYLEYNLAPYMGGSFEAPFDTYVLTPSGDCHFFPQSELTYDSSYVSFEAFVQAWADTLNQLYGSSQGIHAFVYDGKLVIEKNKAFIPPYCTCDGYTEMLSTLAHEAFEITEVSACCSPYRDSGRPQSLPVTEPDPEWEEPLPPLNFDIACIEPVVPFPTDTIQDPCVSYLLELAAETAYNNYQAYLDSVRNAYRLAYRSKCMEALETFTLHYVSDEYHYTLYYYDRAGNLVRTVPPKGVQPIDLSLMTAVNSARDAGTELKPGHNNGSDDALATRYRYNSLNQPLAQMSPDGGQSLFYYDNLGRVVISQNAKQAALTDNVYSYTRYDAQSRITEVGEMTRTDLLTASQAYLHNPLNYTAFFATGFTKGEFVLTYYDREAPGSGYYPAGFFSQENLRKRVAYTTYFSGNGYAPGSTDYMTASYYSYDYHGNVKELLQQSNYIPDTDPSDFNYNYRYHKVSYKYDLVSGKVLEVALNATRQDRFIHRYTYDEQNRLSEARTSADGYWFDTDAAYFYYNHGPLARVEYGPHKSQGLDYTYTVQGWLKSMNSDQLDPEKDPSQDGKTGGIYQYVARDEYGLSLHYFQGDYQSISSGDDFLLQVPGAYYGGYDLFNGNIRAMNNTLRTGSTSEPLLQVFGYDQLNRIGSSRSYIQNAVAASITDWNPSAPLTDMFRTLYTYDANGNIQELHRYDKAGVQFDRLSYGYTAGTNRLDHVSDAIADGVVNYDIDSNDPGNYGYDAIGNLTRDVKEEIGNIGWNVYGKVANVIRSGGSRPDLYFDYNPAGQRIFKLLQPQADLFSWENYVLDAQGNVLAVYAMREGSDTIVLKQNMLYGSSRLGLWERNKKLTFTPVTETIQSVYRGDKRYELSDHLGNVHVVLTDRKELHCGLEDNVPFPEYYTAEVKNR